MSTMKVNLNITFNMPPRGEYDYETYLSHTFLYAGLATSEEVMEARESGDNAVLDQWVVRSMALDYLARGTGCTAALYVIDERSTATAL